MKADTTIAAAQTKMSQGISPLCLAMRAVPRRADDQRHDAHMVQLLL